MAITVGRVIDLNFEPFYIDMVRRGIVLQDVSLKDIPQALRNGEINAGPVSLVDSFALEDICVPVAGFCLSASNKAGSNLLYSKKPMEELSGASIADSSSHRPRCAPASGERPSRGMDHGAVAALRPAVARLPEGRVRANNVQ